MADVLVTIIDLSDVASASAEVATVGVALVDPDSVLEIVEGDNITVDDTDPRRPVVSSTGGGAVDSVNGHVGVVVLGASDVGADAAGAAAAAQAASQPVDSDLTAIAALSTTSFGRSLLALADAAAARTAIGAGTSSFDGAYSSLTGKPTLGTAAAAATGDFDAAGAAASAQAASQPLDSDLTAIAALSTTTFGRSLLAAADAAATRTLIGAGTSSLALGTSSSTAKAGDYQPTAANISDATTIGRTVLTSANAAAVRVAIGLATVAATGAYSDLTGKPTLPNGLPVVWAVEDYGVTVDGTTDDNTAWQNAVNAAGTRAAAASGVAVVLSTKIGETKIGGALQDTSGANAQIVLPSVTVSGTDRPVSIFIAGLVPPSADPSVVGTMPAPTDYLIFKSALTGGSGGAIMRGVGPEGATSFTNVHLGLQNVGFRTPANWTHSALGLKYVACVSMDNVIVDAGSFSVNSIAMQTTSTSIGIDLPDVNNGATVELSRVHVIGFYNGIRANEHTYGENVAAWGCKQALVTTGGYHAANFNRLGVYHCQHGIVATGGALRLRIGQLNIEHAATGTWVPVADIDDTSNFLTGSIEWAVVKATIGIDTTFTQNGGTGLDVAPMGTVRLRKSNNLSDLASASSARTNLGLGTAATVDTGTSSGNIPLLSTGGRLPIARIASGTPDGTKFVRDDGTLVTPTTGGTLTVQDENSNVSTAVTQIDFQGAGVTATAGTGEVIVTIPGGGGGGSVATDTIFDAKGDLAVGTGSDTAARLAAGTNGKVLVADSTQTTGLAYDYRGIIAYNAYNPGTIATYSTTSTTVVDLDATNMAVTFTVPASGKVLVRLSALASRTNSTSNFGSWALRNGSTTVASKFLHVLYSSVADEDYPISLPFVVTGLTPGASVTYKWAHYVNNAAITTKVYAGGIAGDSVMEVHALP